MTKSGVCEGTILGGKVVSSIMLYGWHSSCGVMWHCL